MRVEVNPTRAEQVRHRPGGQFARDAGRGQCQSAQRDSSRTIRRTWQIHDDDQLFKRRRIQAADRRLSQWRARCGLRCRERHRFGRRTRRNAGLANGKPAVLIIIFRQPAANIIETVDRVRALLPQLQASIPPAINDRS